MKKMTDKGILVQKKDILKIYSIYGIVPDRIQVKAFPKGLSENVDAEEFVLFDEQIDIKIINQFEWILDCDKLFNCSLEELYERVNINKDRLKMLRDELENKLDNNTLENTLEKLKCEIELLDYEIEEFEKAISVIEKQKGEESLKR